MKLYYFKINVNTNSCFSENYVNINRSNNKKVILFSIIPLNSFVTILFDFKILIHNHFRLIFNFKNHHFYDF